MYESGKNFITNTISKQIGNALSVAESAVDHFLPEEQRPNNGEIQMTNDNGNSNGNGKSNGTSNDNSSSPQNGHHLHHYGHGNGHSNGHLNGIDKTNGISSSSTDSSLGR
jgi:hypothetical protein